MWAGWASSGLFSFEIAQFAPPPIPRIEDVSFSSTTVDVSTTDQTITARFRLIFPSTIIDAPYITLFLSPSCDIQEDFQCGGLGFIYSNIPQLVSGDASDGVYEAEIIVPSHRPAGNYKIQLYADKSILENDQFVSDSTNWFNNYSVALPPGARQPIKVLNSGAMDVEAPQITSLSVAPTTIDLSQGEQQVTVTAQFSDDVSGLDLNSVYLTLERVPGGQILASSFGGATLQSGSAINGVVSISTTVYPTSTWSTSYNGTYQATLSLADRTGRNAHYDPARSTIPDLWICYLPYPSGTNWLVQVTGSDDFVAPPPSIDNEIYQYGIFSFSYEALLGYRYAVQRSTDLKNWQTVETKTAAWNGNVYFSAAETEQHVYYRVCRTEP